MWQIYNYTYDNIKYIQSNFILVDENYEINFRIQQISNNPYSIFTLFNTDSLIQYINEKSHEYARNCLEKMKTNNAEIQNTLRKPNIKEMNKYIGVIMWLIIHSKNNYKNDWNESNF